MCCGNSNNINRAVTPNMAQAKQEPKPEVQQVAIRQLSTPEDVQNQIRKDFILRKKNGLPSR